MQEKILCSQVNQMDMIDYLGKLGFRPTKVVNNDYWFLSPLREEKTASFKVNRALNCWYDHGVSIGGTLVDFGILYYRCTVKELLSRFENDKGMIFTFHPQKSKISGERKGVSNRHGKIDILNSTEITDPTLRNYLHGRKIPLPVANRYCSQVAFELHEKKHLAIGFKNDRDGYELRNYYFKGSSTPKEPRLIVQKDTNDLLVFEGFFCFLSYMAEKFIRDKNIIELPIVQASTLVLNSIAFFEKSRDLMERHEQVHLFLDNDRMGKECTAKALKWSSKYLDQSHHYKNHKDLNESLIKSENPVQKQTQRKGLRP